MDNAKQAYQAMTRKIEDVLNETRDSGSRRFVISIMSEVHNRSYGENAEENIEGVLEFLQQQIERTEKEGHYMNRERIICTTVLEEFNRILGREESEAV